MLTNQNLAPGSEWRTDPEDGSEFIKGVEGHRIDISVYEPKCVIMTVDEDASAIGDVRDVLAIIDRANLDPVRIEARKLVEMCTLGLLQSEYNRREVAKLAKELKALL